MKNNKGFSLVELIIVIAIMAILAAAIAPALIRYINKARMADDLTAAGEIVSAANTAMTNEKCNDAVMKSGASITVSENGVTGSPSELVAEMSATLPNGAKKKYVKGLTNTTDYKMTFDATKNIFVVTDGDGHQMNPSAASPYDK